MMSYLSGTGLTNWQYSSGPVAPSQAGRVPSGPQTYMPAAPAQGGSAVAYVALGVLAGLVLLYVSTRGVQGVKV